MLVASPPQWVQSAVAVVAQLRAMTLRPRRQRGRALTGRTLLQLNRGDGRIVLGGVQVY